MKPLIILSIISIYLAILGYGSCIGAGFISSINESINNASKEVRNYGDR